MRIRLLFPALALCLVAPFAQAATIVVINNNAPGVGFNDPTPVLPVGGNPGTTLGAQRLNVFQAAAAQWAAVLDSDIDIRVNAQFVALTCSGTSAVLGSAGATQTFRNFPNAPVPNTWFSPAEANALAGVDNNASANDINSNFNVSIDNGTCLTGTAGWWYGLTLTNDIPADRIPLMPVVFHELAHGLGFQTYTSGTSGAFSGGFPAIWDSFLTDANLGTGTAWRDMTAQQRAASAIDDPNLVWNGANVNERARGHLDPKPAVIVHAPASAAGSYDSQPATFGAPAPLSGLRGLVVAGLDGAAPAGDACTPLINAAEVAGKIALVDRGTCAFTIKVANAQAAGAIGVLVANNATGLPGMGGDDPAITIPSHGITQALGTAIRTALVSNPVDVTLGYDFSSLAGMTSGMTRMYGPSPFESGSSVSHFSTAASPNLLMEPSLNESLFSETDLTVPLFRDIHWPILDAALVNGAPTISGDEEFIVSDGVPSPLAGIMFGDVDAGDSPLTLTFAVDDGSLTAAAAAGVTVVGSGTDEVSLTGARAALLPYVVGGNVRFTSTLGDFSDVGLLVTVNDNGNNGSGGAKSDTHVATIKIFINTPPQAVAQSVQTPEDTALPIVLTGTDADNQPLTFTVASPPTHGVVTGTAPALTYTPAPDYVGADSFTFTVNDGSATSAAATITIDVTPVNDAPVQVSAIPDQTDSAGDIVSLDVSVFFDDVDGDTLTFSTSSTLPDGLTLSVAGVISGTLSATSEGVYAGIVIQASDASESVSGTGFTWTVDPANTAPSVADQAFNVNVDAAEGSIVGSIVSSDPDAGDTLTVSVDGGTGAAVFDVDSEGVITVADGAALVAGTLTLEVTVTDAGGLTDSAVISITVRGLELFQNGFED